MNAYFGDNRIALEPIPNDATAVIVRVETWEKMESALATLRAKLEYTDHVREMELKLKQEAILALEECARQHAATRTELDAKTAEIAQLKQHIRDLEEMLRLAGKP